MANENHLSQRQLELQLCLAQRRIDKIRKVLESGVQAPIEKTIDAETAEVITRLYNTTLSDADLSSCIDILEMLLEIEGLKPLLTMMKSVSFDMALRQRAAKAIGVIGSNYIESDLKQLLTSPSSELRELAQIALGKQRIET